MRELITIIDRLGVFEPKYCVHKNNTVFCYGLNFNQMFGTFKT